MELDYSQPIVPQNAVYEFTLPAVVWATAEKEGRIRYKTHGYLTRISEREKPYLNDFRYCNTATHRDSNQNHFVSFSQRIRFLPTPGITRRFHLDQEEGGNKDFVLQYKLAGDQIESSVLMYQGPEENYIAVLMEPPERPSGFRIPLR